MRRAGLLLHPTSLPGPYGAGDLGGQARALLGWLERAGLRIWQVLPLNPVDMHGCPYASSSAFALEPKLLSLGDLVRDGWLLEAELPASVAGGRIDHGVVHRLRSPLIERAAQRVAEAHAVPPGFLAQRSFWLEDWATYVVLTESIGHHWTEWPEPLRDRDPTALAAIRDVHRGRYEQVLAMQWLVAQQWSRLRADAAARGVHIWGDMPIFVGLQSCDVWSHPHLFRLDDHRRPIVLTGVPPDGFTPLGQLWGHPHYDNAAHARTAYAWWLARAEAALGTFDCVRIDHFRGLASVWEVDRDAPDARGGRWAEGLGGGLLQALRERHPSMPFVAEDLGFITEDVHRLRARFGLPGMAVLQFAFDEPGGQPHDNSYLPHHHERNQVVYTGTHDNDTLAGWVRSADPHTLSKARRYLGVPESGLPSALTRAAWRSVCHTAIVPAQDLLGLGSEARINIPGLVSGNWSWRLEVGALTDELAARTREQIVLAGRSG